MIFKPNNNSWKLRFSLKSQKIKVSKNYKIAGKPPTKNINFQSGLSTIPIIVDEKYPITINILYIDTIFPLIELGEISAKYTEPRILATPIPIPMNPRQIYI